MIYFANQEDGEILPAAGPGVAAALDGIDNDFGVLLAAGVDVAVDGGAVWVVGGQVGRFRFDLIAS